MKKEIRIEYAPAKFFRRMMAILTDFLLFALSVFLSFALLRMAFSGIPAYRNAVSDADEIRVDSCLYVESDGQVSDLVSYYGNSSTLSASQIKTKYLDGINGFIAYLDSAVSSEASDTVQADFDSYRMASDMTYQGINLFIENSNGGIDENQEACQAPDSYYSQNVYSPYITDRAEGYLTSLVPAYYNDTHLISVFLIFIDIPVSVFLSWLLVYFVPPLFLIRGRRTLGMALYKIGKVNRQLLNISFGQFAGESALNLFLTVLLSLVTFGLPLVISFSMMAFSRNRQDFADYMLGIRFVSVENSAIYKSKDEIYFEGADEGMKAVDFNPIDRKDE